MASRAHHPPCQIGTDQAVEQDASRRNIEQALWKFARTKVPEDVAVPGCREWEAFASVNRDRDDALLAIAWIPDNPPGW